MATGTVSRTHVLVRCAHNPSSSGPPSMHPQRTEPRPNNLHLIPRLEPRRTFQRLLRQPDHPPNLLHRLSHSEGCLRVPIFHNAAGASLLIVGIAPNDPVGFQQQNPPVRQRQLQHLHPQPLSAPRRPHHFHRATVRSRTITTLRSNHDTFSRASQLRIHRTSPPQRTRFVWKA
jgi:hypothetical protein